jgi:hypothetical protein
MKRWSFVVGAVLVILGVFSLLQVGINALGIHFSIWWIFWPLVLIAAGAWLILGFTRGGSGGSIAPREQAAVPLEGASEAEITVHHGAGRLTIGSGAGSDQLASGSFGGGLEASRRLDGSRLCVDMRVKDRDWTHYVFGPWNGGWAGRLDWDFGLNPSIPIALRLETGASESRLALLDLKVRELVLKTGASSTTVDLPASAGFTRMRVESGAASVKIHVPDGVAASIKVSSAIAGIHVSNARFPRTGGRYESPDYATAANKVEIDIEMGAGAVDVY